MLQQLWLQRLPAPVRAPPASRTREEAAIFMMQSLQGVLIVQQQAFADNTTRRQTEALRKFTEWLQK